eukprot:Hpha_TRINITY_DN33952_c0_g1::TRINITY_DN33952_c0_g1_i1::g.69414::m.69414/K01186/NEU1; sialidase-1
MILLWGCLLLAALLPGAEGTVTLTDLFKSGVSELPWSKGKYTCYRIPSIVRTDTGAVLVFIAERVAPGTSASCSDDNVINILLRRSDDGGKTWSDPTLVFSPGTSTNPWPVFEPKSKTLFMLTNVDTKDCKCDVEYITSGDDGRTWTSTPVVLPQSTGVVGSMLTHGVALQKTRPGRMVGCMRKICKNSCPADYHSKALYSDDGGATWGSSDWLTAGTTECQMAELSNGDVYMTSRPYTGWVGAKNVRLAAWSKDGGSTWGPVVGVPDLIDNGFACEGSVCSDPASDRVYFAHPDSTGRSNLTLYTSSGNATRWVPASNIYGGSAAYSDSVVLNPAPGGDGSSVGVVFEADSYGRLVFARVDL